MKVHDLKDEDGRVVAFEVENSGLSRRSAGRVARAIPGSHIIRRNRVFAGKDEFCEFEVDGVTFVIWEPWGDNSRYWIGPSPRRWVPEIDKVRAAFEKHPGVSPVVRVAVVVTFLLLLATIYVLRP